MFSLAGHQGGLIAPQGFSTEGQRAEAGIGVTWVHEIKLDGYRMAARIDNGRVQLLTCTGLDWTDKYPSAIAALAHVKAKTAHIAGELCGVDDAGLPSFAQTQAATARIEASPRQSFSVYSLRDMPKSLLPEWIPPQLSQLVEKAPSGPQWLHEIKLDGFRMAARIERGEAKLLTRTGLDWTARYPGMSTALAAVRAKTAYLDGELCGVGADGLPSFAEMQAATDGAGGVRLVFYAFDLLHLDGRDTARLLLTERKALLQPIVTDIRGLQFNGHETGDGELIRSHARSLASRASCQRRPTRPMHPAIAASGAKPNALTGRNS